MEHRVEYLCFFKFVEIDGVKQLVMVGKFNVSEPLMVKLALKMFKNDEYYIAYV